ncbi:MAG TPA: quinol:electron acceptor oxidoreductase subunit ActD [Sphingomonas sp.]|nr:quinol:electron acceptor oxidoreductase subunit ActD [Sphingomonas sp.]
MTALVIASYAGERAFRAGFEAAKQSGRRIVGLWSPMPVELDDLGAAEARPIGWIATAGGLVLAGLFYLFIWWSATSLYPFDIGGRPLNSWQVFPLAPVEFGALAAGAAGIVAFLVLGRLTRLHDTAFDIAEVERASSDRFVIAVACDEGADANRLLALLAEAGAAHSRVVTP